ncbi:S8 family serine peptidase [Verrucomicrobiaceae bacterium R5-34]|uniref:S8 family serine peptidase n=1 Tax=Oceaniferula flava TaxID=2800421 RepID=A0AAE2SCX3_9BACT|nr:S8 family serine peptidase [Oceaniferula flavus]MBK1831546.1 S8 family serine peptidase [Verrucomicrobiaceae bacterium R5-34]MBK1854215.1 S8 family serine peptidase [Oceaniferula flavus]MBM1135521.1 S8 family serine peptidase [Oceaniferula flavus]
MKSKTRTSVLLLGIFILAGVATYLLTRSPEVTDNQPTKEIVSSRPPTSNELPANKPMGRSQNKTATAPNQDALPPFALKNERVLVFKDEEAYRKFLASLKARGLTMLGKSDRLLAVRIGLGRGSSLVGIDGADIAYNYLVTIPTLPQVAAQAGAVGFGQNALSWLGIYVDNSAWGEGVTVAVIDSGVNAHIALDGNITTLDLTELADGTTQLSHGTAVASIISGDHPLTMGVAPASEILSIRVTDASGSANTFTLAEGIMAAADNGAQIINISMGTYADSQLLAEAVLYAQEKGSVIVASSGNEGFDSLAYPAAYEDVISVGAVESQGDHLDFSNSGTDLSITAPGYQVNAAWGEDMLTSFSGTSASAPFVSGAIAATMSNYPDLSAQEAADLVLSVTNDAGLPGTDADYGTGILDVGRVIQNSTSGIYDAAISGQTLVPATSSSSLPTVLVTVQNQGTETLINSPVTITSPSGTEHLNVSSLAPGETQTFEVPISIPASGAAVSVSSSVTITSGDADISNNARSTSYTAETE